ncbi:unnamed protein product [Amoebophrya sp. A25]|nr:unnamed protein product [Amoebophrya sp. A25]|eukprot:GSA25T00015949001.1
MAKPFEGIAKPTGAPVLRPQVGFCMRAKITGAGEDRTSMEGSRMYLNFCSHPLIEKPKLPNKESVTKDWLLKHGIGNMQIPLDIGSYRKLKLAAEGAKNSAFCLDVVFHPTMIELFMNDAFNSSKMGLANDQMNTFRAYLSNVAFNMVERELKLKLSRAEKDIKLVKETRYKDPENAKGSEPVKDPRPQEFREIFTEEAVEEIRKEMEAEMKREKEVKVTAPTAAAMSSGDLGSGRLNLPGGGVVGGSSASSSDGGDFVIRESKPKAAPLKKQMKGFFGKKGAKGALYGDGGSGEGVLPENAGDPMGYLPKKLLQTCKIVDTGAPEYQAAEKQRREAEASNSDNNEMLKDLEKWAKKQAGRQDPCSRWAEDNPIGADDDFGKKYDVDYARFDKILEREEAAEKNETPVVQDDRDWYFDSKGNPVKKGAKSGNEILSKAEQAEFRGLAKGWFDKLGEADSNRSGEAGSLADGLLDMLDKFEDPSALQATKSQEPVESTASNTQPAEGSLDCTITRSGKEFTVSIADCERPREVDIEARETELLLTYDGQIQRLSLEGQQILADDIVAKASTKKKTLVLTVPTADPADGLD